MIPTYDKFIEPVLRYLAQRPDGALAREVYDASADVLGITQAERQELLPSRAQAIYKNRAGWAYDRLKRAGMAASIRRGFWQLTPEGVAYAAAHPAPLTEDEVARVATDFMDVRLRPLPDESESAFDAVPSVAVTQPALASPDDRLSEALAEIRQTVTAEVLEALARVSPAFFESVVLDVLHRMGYGTSRADLQRVGGVGDGGIDGVISLDKLGLEKVYVQAKRWQGSVGRPDIQAFYGALAGQRANKGVFITTSGFTAQAHDFARSVERIVLVDGRRLAELMIDHEVGVTAREIRVPKLDGDYFDEESA